MKTNENIPDNRYIVTLTVSEFQNVILTSLNKERRQIYPDDEISKDKSNLIPELIPRKNVANSFSVSTVTLDKWKRAGILPKPVKMAGRVYYVASEILEFINNRK